MSKKNATTFEEYLDKHVSAGTAKLYLYEINRWLADSNGAGLTEESAQDYVDRMAESRSASTVGVMAHAIMNWFKWQGEVVDLDCPSIKRPKPEYISVEQVKDIIDCCATQLERTLVTVLFDTAVRISELLNLRIWDIHYDIKTLTVTRKGGAESDVNISDGALEELTRWIEIRNTDSLKVFGAIDYQYARQVIQAAGKRIGVTLRPHMLRHSRAIDMLKKGAPPYVIQQHLGHKNIATTMDIYGQFTTIDLRERIPIWQ